MNLKIDILKQCVEIDDETIRLQPLEMRLILLFSRNSRPLTRKEVLKKLDIISTERNIDTRITGLNKKAGHRIIISRKSIRCFVWNTEHNTELEVIL
jgi:DNA-binding response OmpR family regulator